MASLIVEENTFNVLDSTSPVVLTVEPVPYSQLQMIKDSNGNLPPVDLTQLIISPALRLTLSENGNN